VRHRNPQVIRFAVHGGRDGLWASPLDGPRGTVPKKTLTSDLCIIGGELEAVVTAMAAADRGLTATLVYAGPLGGLVSDEGGNLRYFDGYGSITRPQEQLRLFREGLGMAPGNCVAIPEGVTPKLEGFLAARYALPIRLVRTRVYESLLVRKAGGRLASVVTEEGTQARARFFVDMDPEARVTEKAGVPMGVDTPALAAGLVFNVEGISSANRERLRRLSHISAEWALDRAGVNWDDAVADPSVARALKHYRRSYARDFIRIYDYYGLGWVSLADGFNLLMQCLATRDGSPALRWLNARRRTSGFNVAFGSRSAAFNSISYHTGPGVLQHSHDILRENRWSAIRDIERPALESYLRELTDMPNIRVTLPHQFYVRAASAHFITLHPYTAADFVAHPTGDYRMAYPNDFRDVWIRDPYDGELMRRCWSHRGAVLHWACRPSSALTCVPNLYSLNKCAMTPEFFGCLRVLQNLTTTGVALARDLAVKIHASAPAAASSVTDKRARKAAVTSQTPSRKSAKPRPVKPPIRKAG